MHPIEQLRFVARSRGIDSGLLVQEAADALGFFANEQRALITACRQLLSRQPGIGPLWWLCTRLVLAKDPRLEARLVLEECWRFSTEQGHDAQLLGPDDFLLISTDAAGIDPDGSRCSLVSTETINRVSEAESLGQPVRLVMGPGVWLPPVIWNELKERCKASPNNDLVLLDLDRVSAIQGPNGKMAPDQLEPSTMPIAPELLVRLN